MLDQKDMHLVIIGKILKEEDKRMLQFVNDFLGIEREGGKQRKEMRGENQFKGGGDQVSKKVDIEIHKKLVVIPIEAAALLSVGKKAILTYMKRGDLRFMMVGGDHKIWMSDLMELREKLIYKKLDLVSGELVDVDHNDVKVS